MRSILDARLINVGGRIYRSTADLSTYAVGAHAKGRVQQSSAANSHLDEEEYREEDEGDDIAIQQEGDTFLLRLKVDNAVMPKSQQPLKCTTYFTFLSNRSAHFASYYAIITTNHRLTDGYSSFLVLS